MGTSERESRVNCTPVAQELTDSLKDAARYLLQNGQTTHGLAVQACVTMLEDDCAQAEPVGMRAAFLAWVQDQGCDTDGAWSAWQGAWSRRLCTACAQGESVDASKA